jgi:DNA-directed RNA polymerase subunit omega
MKAELLKAAGAAIPNQGILVNMVSRRVRQLMHGHRPLVEHAPGLRAADIALMEIAQLKLSYESTQEPKVEGLAADAAKLVEFPATAASKKKAA